MESEKWKVVSVEKNCAVCGKPFIPTRANKKYCSRDCFKAHQREYNLAYRGAHKPADESGEKICPICGKTFKPRNCKQIYCSKDCYKIAVSEQHKADYRTERPLVEKTCTHCGKTFMQTHSAQKFCSTSCRNTYNNRAKSTTFGVELVCPVCGKTFVKHSGHQVYCSRDCYKKQQLNYIKKYHAAKYPPKEPVEKTCPVCGKSFMAVNSKRKYCSHSCCNFAWKHGNNAKKVKKAVEVIPKTVDTSKVEIPSTPKKICPTCGKFFNPRHSSQVYCSNKCSKVGEQTKPAHQFKVIEKTCARCGKTFKTDKYAVKTCPECVQKFAEAKKARLQAKKAKQKKYPCLYCGQMTTHKPFCSQTCHDRYYAAKHASEKPQSEAERRDPFKKTIEQWQKEAEQCGLSYGYYRAQIERFGKTFEELVGSR